MHLHFERIEKPNSYSDSNILTLSWMGKVPDGLLQNQDDDGWKLNRSNYYQDGWIALGNTKSIVGVTYTTCRCRKASLGDQPPRTNYNLRGHRSEVILTRWNEPYQKLASCDSSGIIFVWIKFEGRWSIELINDRNTQVTDFCWSHDGRMALICYVDGFVLIGSVAGQRYWSSMLNLESCSTTCCIWSPDDQQVMFGTSSGHIMVIDINGTLVAEISVRESFNIVAMCWSCEKFKMEDSEDDPSSKANCSKSCVLAVAFIDGTLYLMKNYDDLFPIVINTHLQSIKIEWSNKAEVLAVAGHRLKSFTTGAPSYINTIKFYTESGTLRYTVDVDCTIHPITSLTWGHNDKRLFVATGPVLHIAWITKRVPTLQLLSRLSIYQVVTEEKSIAQLPLPPRLQAFVASLFGKTLRCYLPDISNLRNFVSYPPPSDIRLHCTLIRHDDDIVGSSATYILYLEYLGGLVPILKGKRASKLRPEFVIFDPQSLKSRDEYKKPKSDNSSSSSSYWNSSSNTATSESECEEQLVSGSPISRSRRTRRYKRKSRRDIETNLVNGTIWTKPENGCYDELPEDEKLVLVTSNIWGTKFKLLGLAPWLPSELGSLTYRTSLLHLQPRQMTLCIKELGGARKSSCTESSSTNKNEANVLSSEDEEDPSFRSNYEVDFNVPIAPMTPKKDLRHQTQNSTISPERRGSLFSRPNGTVTPPASLPSYSEYVRFIPAVSEELLTLQINGDANGNSQVTMELSRTNPTPPTTRVPSSSISTQTSFQSVTELLNLMSSDRKPSKLDSETESVISQDISTEEAFSRMAKKFASEFPCSSRTPASQSLAFTKYEIFQTANISENCDKLPQNTSSPVSSPPTMSPPKTFRHKISKMDSPRRSSVSVFERGEISSASASLFSSNSGSQLRFGASTTSNWGGLSICQRSAAPTGESCLLDYKHVLFQGTARDIKYIDDNDTEEGSDSVTFQQRFVKSPSFLVYRNKPVSLNHSFQPISAVNSDFTNIRAGIDQNSYSHQRRLTLRTNRSSYSCDSVDLDDKQSISSKVKDKAANCMLLDEEMEDKEVSADMPCCCVNSEDELKCKEKKCGKSSETNPVNYTQIEIRPREIPSTAEKTVATTTTGATEVRQQDDRRLPRDFAPNTSFSQSTARISTRTLQHRLSLPHAITEDGSGISSILAANSTEIKNRSLPASPLLNTKRKAQGRGLFYSPTNFRRVMKQKLNYFDCSSEDDNTSDEETKSNEFRDLESFQKANIKRKIKVKRRGSRVKPDQTSPSRSPQFYEEFLLHNKAPLWNEVSQVYQLDFGGRVTQESAKNFQIEHQGKQVMQFGRIDGNAYTLDFQYPFSALQALAVALANVTQRLK